MADAFESRFKRRNENVSYLLSDLENVADEMQKERFGRWKREKKQQNNIIRI